MKEASAPSDLCEATVQANRGHVEEAKVEGYYEAVCRDKDGNEKWRDRIKNLVTSAGKNDILDKYFRGSAYTQTIVMGLCGAGTKAVGDTQASHAGWSEVGGSNAPVYTGNRKAVTLGAASGGASVSSGQVFSFTSGGTVAGCFMNNGGSATKDDTTGTLYSAGDFAGGSKVVASGDTVTVTYTATMS